MDSVSRLFQRLDRELWIVTARSGARRGGLVATFVGQASIAPDCPRILVGVGCRHHTHELIEESGAFALHLLGERHLPWVWRFGLRSGRLHDKLEGLSSREGRTGSPLLADAAGFLDCLVEDRLDTGDRTVYLGEVVGGELESDADLLTLRRLIALAPPERLREMRELLDRDAPLDAAAIRRWREERRGGAR